MTAYAQKSHVGLIFQNSYGTAGSVNSVNFIPALSESIGLNIPQLYSENMRGIFDEGDSYVGPKTVDGDIDCEAQPIALGHLLASIMQKTSSIQSGAIYNHVFKPRATDWDDSCANAPVTIYKRLDMGAYERFYDCTGTSLELSVAQGEFLKCKVSYVGGQLSTTSGTPAATYETGKRWKWDISSFAFSGTGNASLVNATIKLDESLEAQHTMSSTNAPSRIKRTGMRNISVDLTLKFDDYSEYLEFQNQTERDFTATFKGPTEIQSGYYEKLTVTVPLLRYEEFKPNASGAGPIEVSAKARGKYSVTSANSLLIALVNTQTTYG